MNNKPRNFLRIPFSKAGLLVLAGLLQGLPAWSAEPFYKGKVIRIVPYVAPGSGTDLQSRILARHLPKYIPGHPKIIVQNMPGGGGIIAANYVFNLAKPDGLTLGSLSRGMPILSLAKASGIEYDARKFRWLGAPTEHTTVCVIRSATGFKTVKDVVGSKKPLILGATGRGAGSFQVPSTLNATLGTNIKIIPGYRGASAMHLAMETGEIDGRCLFYFGVRGNAFLKNGVDSGKLRIIVQMPVRHPDLPGVPVFNRLTSKPEDLALMKLMAAPFFHWVAPPGIPNERLTVLREGFMKTYQDSDFQAEANKIGLDVNPLSGEKVEQIALKMMEVPEGTIRKIKKILGQ
jgi:tripartite-type tricarboxylate transporter receptor subunit TctC